MANPKNKQGTESDSTQQNPSNVSEFSPQSAKTDKGASFGSESTSTHTSGLTPAGSSAQGNPSSTQGQTLTESNLTGQTGSRSQGSTGGAATATARSFIDQAKETAGQAYEAVTEKAATTLDQRKTTISSGLTTVADSVRQVSENLGSSKTESGLAEAAAKYTNTAAKKLQDAAGYFEGRNVKEMARDLEGFARRNPALFFGAAFGLGVIAARFLKSTPTRYNEMGAGAGFSGSSDRRLNSPSSQNTTSEFSSNPR
jgi:hypothetical protein